MSEHISSESNSVVNRGQMSGVNIGGTHNQAVAGSSTMMQTDEFLAELRLLLSELEKGSPDERPGDVAKIRDAVHQAESGRLDAAKRSLADVGRWVLDVAQRVGATVVTKQLEGYFG